SRRDHRRERDGAVRGPDDVPAPCRHAGDQQPPPPLHQRLGAVERGHGARRRTRPAKAAARPVRPDRVGAQRVEVYGAPREGTVGVPLPGLLVRLGADGEIHMRGPQVFSGYLGGEPGFTDDGWFRTGDLGRLDDAAKLVIEGRSKDLIITGGLKVHPREVEVVLEQHPSVAEAAVARVPSEAWGEQVTAWVVIRPNAAFDPAALIAHARESLAPYKTPKQVLRVDELPRNAVGKIDRRRLTLE